MSATRIILAAHVRSARSALRHDMRMRIVWLIILVAGIAGGMLSARQLAGALAAQLWLLFVRAWVGIGILAVLSTLRDGLSGDEALLLLTLPILPATRFRALCARILVEQLGIWLLLLAGVLGATLGWEGLIWLILGLAGMAAAAMCSIIGTLLIVRYAVPHSNMLRRSATIGGIGLGLGLFAALAGWIAVPPSILPAPGLASALCVLLLIIVTGPLAGQCGRLYVAAFHALQGYAGQRRTITPPGVAALCRSLARYRNIAGAMAVKEVLNQSRNPFNWARGIAVALYLLLFPWVSGRVMAYGMPATLVMTGYVAALTLLTLIDAAPSPLGSEGNRLTLYLSAPCDLAGILRAKLAVFLAPLLLEGLVLSLALGLWLRLPIGKLLFAVIVVALMIVGTTALLTWGSAWDEDLNLPVEGPMVALLHEQVPTTPRRIWLINLSILMLAGALLLICKLPALLALPALALLDAAVLAGTWRFSRRYLHRLLRWGVP
jgi:hypothetical protein